MSDFDAKNAANEVLNDGFTPEELAAIKNPRYVEPGDYFCLIKGFKVFEPNPEKNQNGACYYDLEIVRPERGMPLDWYPRQSLRFYSTSDESAGMWLKVCPEYIKSLKPGASKEDAFKMMRMACVGAKVIVRIHNYEGRDGDTKQGIKILSVSQD